MPITRSAKKALRQSERRRVFNLARKNTASSAVKSLKKLIVEGKKKEAMATFKTVQKALDKATKTGSLNKNTASRKKSRLARMIKNLG